MGLVTGGGGEMGHWRAIEESRKEVSAISARLAAIEVKLDVLTRAAWLVFSAMAVLIIGAIARVILIGGA